MSPTTSHASSSNAYDVAAGEGLPERGEELVELRLPVGVAPRTQHADGLVARPDGPPGRGVAVVQGEFRLVQRRLRPGQEILAVGHAPRMRSCAYVPGDRGLIMVPNPSVKPATVPQPLTLDSQGPRYSMSRPHVRGASVGSQCAHRQDDAAPGMASPTPCLPSR